MWNFSLEYEHLLEVFTFIYLIVFYYAVDGSCSSSVNIHKSIIPYLKSNL